MLSFTPKVFTYNYKKSKIGCIVFKTSALITALSIENHFKHLSGVIDTSLSHQDLMKIRGILEKYQKNGIAYHGLRSRQSATRRFMSVHILVPGNWAVQKGHNLLEKIELEICKYFPKMTVITHLEPIEDPKSQEDILIDRP